MQNINILALITISVSVTLMTSAILSTSSPSLLAYAKGDKCISGQFEDDGTSIACFGNKKDPGLSGENKKQCREEFDKCSSSQTGFGEFDNLKFKEAYPE